MSAIPEFLRRRFAKLATSGAGAVLIAAAMANYFEGRVHTVYLDPVGIPTVCEGITGPDVVPGKTYSDAECDVLLRKHLLIASNAAKRVIQDYDFYSEWRKAALIDFTFNVGAANLASSTLAKKFNAGDEVGGCKKLVKWVKARKNGILITLKGLVTRRGAEEELCLEGFTP